MSLLLILLAVVIVLLTTLYLFVKKRFSYWKDRNVLHVSPNLLYGNTKNVMTTRHITDAFTSTYQKFKNSGPFVGFYLFFSPTAFIVDLDLVQRILVKDFNQFIDRGQFVNTRDDPLTGHLFNEDGQKWKILRQKLSPTFTSGKMKFMFPTVLEVGNRFCKVFGENVKEGAIIEIKDLNARFTTDVIGTCAFGIECNSLKDPATEFRVIGNQFFVEHRHIALIEGLMMSYPKLAAKLRMKLIPDNVTDFFMKVVHETVEYREKHGIKRNDFMDMLIELKNNKVTYNEIGEEISGITMDELAAQAFVFFLAGFETSSATMSFLLYELAQNQEIQDKLRQEINDVLAAHDGELTYECMKELKYMEQVIMETLRKYSIVPMLVREAISDYKVPNSHLVIEKGTMTIIPIDAIQNDPQYYPNPQTFDPERFTPEEIQKRHPMAWLPFGDGPRNCIGLRFGKMQVRVGLVNLIKNFNFTTCEKTPIPIVYDPLILVANALGGLYLQVNPI